MATNAHHITDEALSRLLEKAAGKPVVIEHNGVRYRVTPEDPFAFYDPEKVKAAIDAGFGAWKDADFIKRRTETPAEPLPVPDLTMTDRDALRQVVQAAKPRKKSLEWGPETRYGREDDFNAGFNEGIDVYEAALRNAIDDAPEPKQG